MDTCSSITLVLADDHAIVREGIAALCRSRSWISIVGQCGDGESAAAMILELKPDFAVLDLSLPKLDGLQVLRLLRGAGSLTKIVILSVQRDEKVIRDLFAAGADGYVLKDAPAGHLFDAVERVRNGGRYLTPLLRPEAGPGSAQSRNPRELLSKREYEVFVSLAEGRRPRDIAKTLAISPKTVDTYRANIMRKLEVDGIASLVRFAIERDRATRQPLEG